MGEQMRSRYKAEVIALEEMNWEDGSPEDLTAFFEPNTFLSIPGYKHLIPKVFKFCLKWRTNGSNKDIIRVMLTLPFLGDTHEFIDNFDNAEKKLLWAFLEEGHKLIGEDIFLEEEDAGILEAKLTGGR